MSSSVKAMNLKKPETYVDLYLRASFVELWGEQQLPKNPGKRRYILQQTLIPPKTPYAI
jgi:hypothetical protein